jgi:hypothetical protein
MKIKTILEFKPGQSMSLAALEQTPEFRRLSRARAAWVRAYVQNFLDTGLLNHTLATKAAYACANDESARTFGHRIKNSPSVKAVLDVFSNSWKRDVDFTREEIQQQIAEIQKHLDASEPGSTAANRLIELKVTLMRDLKRIASAPPSQSETVLAEKIEVRDGKRLRVRITEVGEAEIR